MQLVGHPADEAVGLTNGVTVAFAYAITPISASFHRAGNDGLCLGDLTVRLAGTMLTRELMITK